MLVPCPRPHPGQGGAELVCSPKSSQVSLSLDCTEGTWELASISRCRATGGVELSCELREGLASVFNISTFCQVSGIHQVTPQSLFL